MRSSSILFLAFFCPLGLISQIKGLVKDRKGDPIVHAEITNDRDQSVIFTDAKGAFQIDKALQTILTIYKDGFFPKTYTLTNTNDILVYLKRLKGKNALGELIVVAKDPISRKFSATKMTPLDIYFNPAASADPLKAVNTLPYSTNPDENAAVALRGGAADRSRVLINGLPIRDPARNSRAENTGSYSLFSPAIMEKQYVYASNPPLIYGNSSAGIVAIETKNSLRQNELGLSLGLAGVSFVSANRLGSDQRFLQLYGNFLSSKLYMKVNRAAIPNLLNFSDRDWGLNLRVPLSKHSFLKSYNYFTRGGYQGIRHHLNYTGTQDARQTRFFSANSFDYRKGKRNLRLSLLIDRDKRRYAYGVLDAQSHRMLYFGSLDFKYRLSHALSAQVGNAYSLTQYRYDHTHPLYYYSQKKGAPARSEKFGRRHQYAESYLYLNYDVNNRLGFSSGLRTNVPLDGQKNYWSYQASSFFKTGKNKFVLALGKYHSYSTPDYLSHYHTGLLSSFQLSADHHYTARNFQLASALYYKVDDGAQYTSREESIEQLKSLGVELGMNYNINRYLSLGVSNTFLHQRETIGDEHYNSTRNLKYYLRTQLTYNNPKILTASLYFSSRPGNHYTPVVGSVFDSDAATYRPIFSHEINSAALKGYSSLDFSMSKLCPLGHYGVIAYLSLYNILNRKNEAAVFYNEDYSQAHRNFFRGRMVYFGLSFQAVGLLAKKR